MGRSPASGTWIPGRASPPHRISPYERIKQGIMSGDLLPGEPLVESALAEWCEVSRTPVREALTRLEQDGLVARGDHGLVVHECSPAEILDIYETRIVLEACAARVAAERRTTHDLLDMRRVEERGTRVDVTDAQALAESNRDFHRSVWRASHNDSLIDLLERLNLQLGRYPATTLAFPGRPAAAHHEHLGVIDAIEGRDAEGAAAMTSQHFAAAREIRLRLWESE